MIFKKTINKLDNLLGTDIYRFLSRIKRKFGSTYISDSERVDFSSPEMKRKIRNLIPQDGNIKLHLGCGKKHFDGYINIDLSETSATDLVCNIKKLPFEDNSVKLIETYHVIEHMPRHDLPIALKEWHRVLGSGGKLIIEFPDFDETARQYLAGNESRIDNIFGLQRFLGDAHMFGYNFKRLKELLEESGFVKTEERPPQDYHKEQEPCLRAEAYKP